MKSKLLTLIVGLCMGNFYPSTVIADTINWITPTGGEFADPMNWSPPMVPGILDKPIFDLPDTYTVSFQSLVETGPLNVVNGDVTFYFAEIPYSVNGKVDIGGSLAVENGTLDVGGNINVSSGGELNGSGMVVVEKLNIAQGGYLRGSLFVLPSVLSTDTVINSGTVAPGNGSGSLRIDTSYQQTALGTLEIEVGGVLIPGLDHDQLVTGSALLAGRLNVPFIDEYTPSVGQNIPFLETLSGGDGRSSIFDIISLPDYQASPVAVQVDYQPDSATLNFVAPTMVASSANAPPISFWGASTTWSDNVPTTSDVVTLTNSGRSPARVDLDVGLRASRRAFGHEVNISSLTAAPLTLGIPAGTSLSAISRVAVSKNGIMEMSGGNVFTNLVQVDTGGTVLGNGTIAGDVVLGDGLASGDATLSPGIPGSATGTINAENLTINSNGVLAITIEDTTNFGRLVVEQTTVQGGRLVIDATNYAAPIGTQFNIMLSGAIENHFDSVETVGSSTIFFAQPPSPILAAVGEASYDVQSYSIGDMNLDNFVDSADAPDFVLGLLDPIQYWTTHGFMFPVQAGNFHPGNSFDFDDIEGFTDAVEGLVAADIYALIEQMSVPEPTTGGLLLLASGLLGATRARRLKC